MNHDRAYTITSLSEPDALVLEVEGKQFPVVQFNAAFAANDIPVAMVTLGVGRQARRRATTPAAIHREINHLRQMRPAKIWLKLRGEAAPGIPWNEERQCIFDGYVAGVGYRKTSGTVQVVARLVHWLVDLSCSSMLSNDLHHQNPGSLNIQAVLNLLSETGATASPEVAGYVSGTVPAGITGSMVQRDLWTAIKNVMYALADRPNLPAGPLSHCVNFTMTNNRAIRALKRIESLNESGAPPFELPAPFNAYSQKRYSVPLALENASTTIIDSIALAIGSEVVASYANQTFWEKLVGQLFPQFGMVIIPAIDRAVVAADLVGYNGGFWKTIDAVSVDMNDALEYPVRGVGVMLVGEIATGAGQGEMSQPPEVVGGCYAHPDIKEGEGVVRIVSAPPWLRFSSYVARDPGETRQLYQDGPERTVDSDQSGQPPALPFVNVSQLLQDFCTRYARLYFVNSYLRGRNGMAASKLRFDIAPGSIVRIEHGKERFIDERQGLEAVMLGCVSRVTIIISAEAKTATTAFDLVAMRTEEENRSSIYGISEHPLYGRNIHGGGKCGMPLLPAYDLESQ